MNYETEICGRPVNLLFFGRPNKEGKYVFRGADRLCIKEHYSFALIEIRIIQNEFPAATRIFRVTVNASAEIDRKIALRTPDETFDVEKIDEEGMLCPPLIKKKMDEHLDRIGRAIDLYDKNKGVITVKERKSIRLRVRTLSDEEKLRYEIEDKLEKYDYDTFFNVITKMAKDLKKHAKEAEAEESLF